MKYIAEVQQHEDGDYFIELSPEMLAGLNWKEGDTIHWHDNKDGSWTMSKREWVLVETISQFRQRYLVQVPQGKSEWALDTVTMEEAKEFSQHHLGETIVSHRVISEQDALNQFRVDHNYLASWSDEQIIENGFTKIEHYDPNYEVDESVSRFSYSVDMLMNPPTEVYEELRK